MKMARVMTSSNWRAINGETNFLSQHSPSTRYIWGRDLSGTLDGAGGVGGLLATEVGGTWYFPLYDNNGNPPTDFRA